MNFFGRSYHQCLKHAQGNCYAFSGPVCVGICQENAFQGLWLNHSVHLEVFQPDLLGNLLKCFCLVLLRPGPNDEILEAYARRVVDQVRAALDMQLLRNKLWAENRLDGSLRDKLHVFGAVGIGVFFHDVAYRQLDSLSGRKQGICSRLDRSDEVQLRQRRFPRLKPD